MRYCKNTVAGYALLALATSLVIAQEDEEEVKEVEIDEAAPVAEEACFDVRSIRNFDGLDDEYVYVQGRGSEHFLLTMDRSCFGLRNAIGIAISNEISRVCSNSFARITYRELGRLETCRIREVASVEDKAAAEAIVESRTRRQ